MTLKSEEKLLEICDLYASGLSYVGSAKAAGVAPRTLFQWLKQSTADDPTFLIKYMDEEMQFSQAMALARKMVHMEVRAALERRSMLGHEEKIFFQGRPTWVEDERCLSSMGWTEEDREMCGYPRDGILRDKRGRRVQLTQRHEAPIQAQLRVVEMSFGEEYTPSSNVNVVNKDTGVLRAEGTSGKVVVPPKPAPRALEVLPDEPEPVVSNDDDDDLLGPIDADDAEPEADPVAQVAEPDPGPMIREIAPANLQPTPQESGPLASLRPMSPLLADLIRRQSATDPAVRAAPIPKAGPR